MPTPIDRAELQRLLRDEQAQLVEALLEAVRRFADRAGVDEEPRGARPLAQRGERPCAAARGPHIERALAGVHCRLRDRSTPSLAGKSRGWFDGTVRPRVVRFLAVSRAVR